MNAASYPHQLKKRQIRQSFLTLVLFLVTFFAHSEHYAQVDFETFSTFELHDCHLCQQGIDSPPAAIRLHPVLPVTYYSDEVCTSSIILVTPTYLSPQLRAPPSFL